MSQTSSNYHRMSNELDLHSVSEIDNAIVDMLECLVDRITLLGVTEKLADVCELKAAHLEQNWNDSVSAEWWRLHADVLRGIGWPN